MFFFTNMLNRPKLIDLACSELYLRWSTFIAHPYLDLSSQNLRSEILESRAGQYCNLENRLSQIQLATGLINKFRPSEYSKKEKRKVFSNFGQGGQKIQIGRFSLYFARFFYYHARDARKSDLLDHLAPSKNHYTLDHLARNNHQAKQNNFADLADRTAYYTSLFLLSTTPAPGVQVQVF